MSTSYISRSLNTLTMNSPNRSIILLENQVKCPRVHAEIESRSRASLLTMHKSRSVRACITLSHLHHNYKYNLIMSTFMNTTRTQLNNARVVPKR